MSCWRTLYSNRLRANYILNFDITPCPLKIIFSVIFGNITLTNFATQRAEEGDDAHIACLAIFSRQGGRGIWPKVFFFAAREIPAAVCQHRRLPDLGRCENMLAEAEVVVVAKWKQGLLSFIRTLSHSHNVASQPNNKVWTHPERILWNTAFIVFIHIGT